jgi:hypothetical protein
VAYERRPEPESTRDLQLRLPPRGALQSQSRKRSESALTISRQRPEGGDESPADQARGSTSQVCAIMVLNTPRRVGAALVNEYRDYENGVADVLAYLAGGSATVYRDVRLSGMRSGRKRQIDVLVRGRIFGSADVTMIVDCKRRKKPVDVKAIDSFIGMVGDVGAEVGMIVTSSGSTAAAQARAKAERGIQLEMLGLNELVQWSPPGTLGITYGVPTPRLAGARAAGGRMHRPRAQAFGRETSFGRAPGRAATGCPSCAGRDRRTGPAHSARRDNVGRDAGSPMA